jgi:hypothetical protein
VTSESGVVHGSGPQVPNTYTLQLNTKPFTTSVCNNHPTCRGWQQFIYSNAGVAFIQYWLLRYNAACPSPWYTYTYSGSSDIYCWRNGANAVPVPAQPITNANLLGLHLTGTAHAGSTDAVVMHTGAGDVTAANLDSMLNLASGWKGVEFTLVGDCCSSQANFNAGTTLVVRTTVHNGTLNAPSCLLEGFTGETNNLNLVGTPPIPTAPSPAIVSRQTSSLGTPASCATAAGVGDTHLMTFGGLLYDFQASGDFVLAETGPDFTVQVRQVSGAPTWPDASVNKAVGMRIGRSRITICLGERPLRIDGHAVDLANGTMLNLPDGGDVLRIGDAFLIRAPGGDSVRAQVESVQINVTVGLGRWPANVHGLLANANGNLNAIAARDGTIFTNPFSFDDLYHHYGDSWRVPLSESLCDCGDSRIERGNPQRPFFARDLPSEIYQHARQVCVRAGVRADALLDACTLDVAVIGTDAAARVFVHSPTPNAVARITLRQRD